MPFYEELFFLWCVPHKKQTKKRPLRAEHKRVSLLDSLQASMTVEAAMVLPLYIFFLCNVLYIMEAVRFQSSMNAALHEAGMRMCEYEYYAQEGAALLSGGTQKEEGKEENKDPGAPGGLAVSAVLSEGYVRSSCRQFLGEAYLEKSCVEGGAGGISYFGSRIPDEDGCIDLRAVYRIRAFVPVLAPASYRLGSQFYAHPFTGYDLTRSGEEDLSDDDEMVYITTTSVHVYHRDRNCTYLQPNIQMIPAGSVDGLRNDQGAKYYPCEVCHPSKTGMLYITSDGTRYHSSNKCTTIYREHVEEVPLSEVVNSRHACVRCGKAGG